MCFKRAMRFLFCALLRFFRVFTTVARRVFSNVKLSWRNTAQINMSDEECGFDSTWEDGDEIKTPIKKMSYSHGRSRRNMFAARDMQDFRHSCRDLDHFQNDDDDDGEQVEENFFNLAFYRGEIRSSPDDLYINDFHKNWFGKYQWLEDVHSYIQWLFPIQEPGVNWRAHVLSKKEIMLFRKDEAAKKKLVQSYKLMLDFYGMRLVSDSTGEVERANNWRDRYKNLDRHTHNNLRITRILKCLGTLGLEHYQEPLVKFFLCETLVKGQLPNVKQSALDYFMFAVLDKSQRRELVKYAFQHFKPQQHFVWGPRKVLSGQPTGNGANVRGATQYMNKIDYPPKDKKSKYHQNNDGTAFPNKLTDTISENEAVGGKKNHLIAGVSNGDEQDELTQTNSENLANKNRQCSSKKMSHGDVGNDDAGGNDEKGDVKTNYEIQNKESEDNQKRLNTHESKDQIEKMDISNSSEEVKSKTDQQNKNETVIPSKMTEGIGVSDDSDNAAPANMSHGHDAFGDSHQTKDGASSQGNEVEIKEKPQDESEDNQKSLKPHESIDETENIETSHSSEEVKSKTDQQNKNETVILSKMTDGNGVSDDSDNAAPANMSHGHDAFGDSHQTKDGALSQGNEVEIKEKPEDESEENKNEPVISNKVTEGNSVRVSDDIKNTVSANVSHGHDAASACHKIEDGTLSQGNDVEMKDEAENIHTNSDNEQ